MVRQGGAAMDEGLTMIYEVRGPDPDGDWFVVLVDGDDETAIDEVFSSEGDAATKCAALNAKSADKP